MMLGTPVGEERRMYAPALVGCVAVAHGSGQPPEPVYAPSPGRLGAIVAGLVGLAGVVVGGPASCAEDVALQAATSAAIASPTDRALPAARVAGARAARTPAQALSRAQSPPRRQCRGDSARSRQRSRRSSRWTRRPSTDHGPDPTMKRKVAPRIIAKSVRAS